MTIKDKLAFLISNLCCLILLIWAANRLLRRHDCVLTLTDEAFLSELIKEGKTCEENSSNLLLIDKHHSMVGLIVTFNNCGVNPFINCNNLEVFKMAIVENYGIILSLLLNMNTSLYLFCGAILKLSVFSANARTDS